MKPALVVTSIVGPNEPLSLLAAGAIKHGWSFYVIGDQKSPVDFRLAGCQYLAIADQLCLPFRYSQQCPPNHYARKNIGYLVAIRDGAKIIVETDDDNLPRESFWAPRELDREGVFLPTAGWTNVYKLFSDNSIWPRGFPLTEIRKPVPNRTELSPVNSECPIQQGLADGNPDVDAIYRLVFDHDTHFTANKAVILGENAWCPFNSQNTTWFESVFPFLYLPAHCSFRMTDIWRSFVATRWLQKKRGRIAFHSATVYQQRNQHNLMKDFADEVVGYLSNSEIKEVLEAVPWSPKPEVFMQSAYAQLIARGWVGKNELELLASWFADLANLGLRYNKDGGNL